MDDRTPTSCDEHSVAEIPIDDQFTGEEEMVCSPHCELTRRKLLTAREANRRLFSELDNRKKEVRRLNQQIRDLEQQLQTVVSERDLAAERLRVACLTERFSAPSSIRPTISLLDALADDKLSPVFTDYLSPLHHQLLVVPMWNKLSIICLYSDESSHSRFTKLYEHLASYTRQQYVCLNMMVVPLHDFLQHEIKSSQQPADSPDTLPLVTKSALCRTVIEAFNLSIIGDNVSCDLSSHLENQNEMASLTVPNDDLWLDNIMAEIKQYCCAFLIDSCQMDGTTRSSAVIIQQIKLLKYYSSKWSLTNLWQEQFATVHQFLLGVNITVPLVIVATSGNGKSLFLSRCILQHLGSFSLNHVLDRIVLYFFITDHNCVLASRPCLQFQILWQLRSGMMSSFDIPCDAAMLDVHYHTILSELATLCNKPIDIFVDNVDKCDSYAWLFDNLPTNVKVIVTVTELNNGEINCNMIDLQLLSFDIIVHRNADASRKQPLIYESLRNLCIYRSLPHIKSTEKPCEIYSFILEKCQSRFGIATINVIMSILKYSLSASVVFDHDETCVLQYLMDHSLVDIFDGTCWFCCYEMSEVGRQFLLNHTSILPEDVCETEFYCYELSQYFGASCDFTSAYKFGEFVQQPHILYSVVSLGLIDVVHKWWRHFCVGDMMPLEIIVSKFHANDLTLEEQVLYLLSQNLLSFRPYSSDSGMSLSQLTTLLSIVEVNEISNCLPNVELSQVYQRISQLYSELGEMDIAKDYEYQSKASGAATFNTQSCAHRYALLKRCVGLGSMTSHTSRYVLRTLGLLAVAMGNYELAIEHCNELIREIERHESIHSSTDLFNSQCDLSVMYKLIGERSTAISVLERLRQNWEVNKSVNHANIKRMLDYLDMHIRLL